MEARDFLFRMTFLENKKYADVLMDNSAVLQNVEASHFYNLPDGTPLDQIIQLPGRAGILTRAPFLGTGTETTSPIRRGAFIRRQILCDTLSSPDPDKLPDRSLSAPVADPTQAQTTRERYAAKTASNECMQCHSKINSLGFAFEDFDSLGRNRSTLGEPVFQVNGDSVTLVKMLPVNASVASIDINNGDNIPVNGGIQLMNTLAASEKANTCFVRQVYRYTGGRIEDGGDDCQMKAMYDEMGKDGGSIMGLLKALPRQPNFRLRKVGI